MRPRFRVLLAAWAILLALLAMEWAASFLPLGAGERPLILLPALAMAAVVGVAFMRIGDGPAIVRLFAVAALLWLLILLGLGSLDPLTRTEHSVQPGRGPAAASAAPVGRTPGNASLSSMRDGRQDSPPGFS
jgi:cytochrome c oxidase subunit IV